MKRHYVSDDNEAGHARLRPLWMRALGLALVWLLVLQPTVATAAIAQEPLFSVSALPPNVMLIMDDSNSMREYTLPLPGGISLPSPTCRSGGTGQPIDGVTVPTRIGNRCVHLEDDWALRSPALNPLWYNPAITYKPWNDNNKPAATNFPQANWGGSTAVADPAQLTPWDMRKWPALIAPAYTTSPFYTPSVDRVTTNTGTIGSLPQVVSGTGRYIRYPGMPAEGPTGQDLFTGGVGFTCNLCLTYDQVPVYGPFPPCLAYAQDPVYGPLPPCLAYFQVPVYGPAPPCAQYAQNPVYGVQPPCAAYEQVDVITCRLVPDGGEESGYRQECTVTGQTNGACINQPPAPITWLYAGRLYQSAARTDHRLRGRSLQQPATCGHHWLYTGRLHESAATADH